MADSNRKRDAGDFASPEAKVSKNTTRRVIVVPGEGSIDEEDFIAADGILAKVGDILHGSTRTDGMGRLRVLMIDTHWAKLPNEICNLTTLQTLNVKYFDSKLTLLPASVGRLKNLTYLDLSNTSGLWTLPEEIGNLGSLETLRLNSSGVNVLPKSIGRLQSLKELGLKCTENLVNLPVEVGHLVSLEKLDLYSSNLKLLPPSIGQLHNMEYLSLEGASKLTELPETIGNLTNLKTLTLGSTGITSLPHSFWNLKGLKHLILDGLPLQESIILRLSNHFLKLGSMGWKTEGKFREVGKALARNRAKGRMQSWNTNERKSMQTLPYLLKNAQRAFESYPSPYPNKGYLLYQKPFFQVSRADAIYQVLDCGRESFLLLIMSRVANTSAPIAAATTRKMSPSY